MKAYDLKARGILGKSWLYLLLICKHYKVASNKGSMLHSKLVIKELGRDNYVLNTTLLISCLTLQLFQTDETFKVNAHKRSNTHTPVKYQLKDKTP